MSSWHRLAAWGALFRRYRETFADAWHARTASLAGQGLLREDEAEFLPAALALQEKPLSPTARWTARTLMMVVVGTALWSILGTVDIMVTASGKIVPSARTKTITAVDTAVVRALHVDEGSTVKQGELLIELDTSASDADHDKADGDALMAALQVARSRALISAIDRLAPPRMPTVEGATPAQWLEARSQLEGQYRDFHARLVRIEADLARYTEDLPLATRRADDYRDLLKEHDVSEHAWIEKEQARIALAGELADAQAERSALIAEARKDAQDALTEGLKSGAASRQDERRAGEHSKLLKLLTPVDGTVQQLTIHTIGAAVPAAQPLMMIVPREERIEIEAYLENKDVGFVQEGQSAEVKIDAFEYTKYGTLPAHITHVSRDAVDIDKKGLLYTVKIALDRSSINVDGRMMPLTPGMSASAEIKTGSRRVIEYVLSPLVQHAHEALHER